MRIKALLVFLGFALCSLGQENDTLYIYYDQDTEFPGYLNAEGDTVVKAGVYEIALTEKFIHLLMVVDPIGKAYAIDRSLDTLFEVYWYDNGPDYIEDGLFRIVENGMIGFANEKGEVVITPAYECAGVFYKGRAHVAYSCERTREGEFTVETSEEWLVIDREGNIIPED